MACNFNYSGVFWGGSHPHYQGLPPACLSPSPHLGMQPTLCCHVLVQVTPSGPGGAPHSPLRVQAPGRRGWGALALGALNGDPWHRVQSDQGGLGWKPSALPVRPTPTAPRLSSYVPSAQPSLSIGVVYCAQLWTPSPEQAHAQPLAPTPPRSLALVLLSSPFPRCASTPTRSGCWVSAWACGRWRCWRAAPRPTSAPCWPPARLWGWERRRSWRWRRPS